MGAVALQDFEVNTASAVRTVSAIAWPGTGAVLRRTFIAERI